MAQRGWTSSLRGVLQATLTAAMRGRGSPSAWLMLPGRALWPSCRSNWTIQGPSQTPAKQVGAITDALADTIDARFWTWLAACHVCCSGQMPAKQVEAQCRCLVKYARITTQGMDSAVPLSHWQVTEGCCHPTHCWCTDMQHTDHLHPTKFGELPQIVTDMPLGMADTALCYLVHTGPAKLVHWLCLPS